MATNTITRAPLVNDDGSGTTGTIVDKPFITTLYDSIDVTLARVPTGPAASIAHNVAVFSDTTGKDLRDVGLAVGNVPQLNSPNYFTDSQSIAAATPILNWNETAAPANARAWRFVVAGQSFWLQATDDGGGSNVTVFRGDRTGNLISQGSFYEVNRSTPMGHWLDAPISISAEVGTISGSVWFRYTQIGRTVIIRWALESMTLSNDTPAVYLQLPVTPANWADVTVCCDVWTPATSHVVGFATIQPGATNLQMFGAGAGAFAAGAFVCRGQISYERLSD